MPSIICHNKGRYNIYSTISDGFRFVESIDIDQLKGMIKEEQGSDGLSRLDSRLATAYEVGASSNESLDDCLICNRAGDNEKHLTTEQCIAKFLS
jgi:hypothetical protein